MNKNNALFIRVPKTASSSIVSSIISQSPENKTSDDDHLRKRLAAEKNNILFIQTHNCLNVIETLHNKFDLQDVYTFGFVRNPFDRAVSSWRFGGHGTSWNCTFKEFCKKISKINLTPDNGRAVGGDLIFHACEQHPFLICEKNSIRADYIGRFENLEKDYNHVRKKLGLGHIEIPHRNNSNKNNTHYTEHYDKETIKIISDVYAKDIEHFGYKYGE